MLALAVKINQDQIDRQALSQTCGPPRAGSIAEHLPVLQPPHPAAPPPARAPSVPTWRAGDRVRWQQYTGTFLRETIDGEAEVLIGKRICRVPAGELRSA